MIRSTKTARPSHTAPHEQTFAETREWLRIADVQTPVEAVLRSGERLTGTVEAWDADAVGLVDKLGRSRVLRKGEIRYVALLEEP
jgi:hypothetical protein